MRLVTHSSSSDEYDDADSEYAYVVLTQDLAKVIAARLNHFDKNKEEDPGLLEAHFASDEGECGFFTHLGFNDDEKGFLPGEEVEKHLEAEGWCEIPEDNSFRGDLSRDSFDEVFGVSAEYTYMVINEHGVYWEMYPTHSNIRLNSGTLPRELIQRVI